MYYAFQTEELNEWTIDFEGLKSIRDNRQAQKAKLLATYTDKHSWARRQSILPAGYFSGIDADKAEELYAMQHEYKTEHFNLFDSFLRQIIQFIENAEKANKSSAQFFDQPSSLEDFLSTLIEAEIQRLEQLILTLDTKITQCEDEGVIAKFQKEKDTADVKPPFLAQPKSRVI